VTGETLRACRRSIELLEHCPIATDVDIKSVLGECRRLKLDDLADEVGVLADLMTSKNDGVGSK
jgi:hypothetical protein